MDQNRNFEPWLWNYSRCINNFQGEACPYGEACTFCYNKEEEEIWTWERRGLFNRNRLFVEIIKDPINHYLKQYNYYFYKLCKTCIDEQKYDQINCQQKPQCQQKQNVSSLFDSPNELHCTATLGQTSGNPF